MPAAKLRPLTFGVTQVSLRHGEAGIQYLSATQALKNLPLRITDRLAYSASTAPEQTFMARRGKLVDDTTPGGVGKTDDWQHISYAQGWASARCIARALINRGLSDERPVAILSENDLDHALLAPAALKAAAPRCLQTCWPGLKHPQ